MRFIGGLLGLTLVSSWASAQVIYPSSLKLTTGTAAPTTVESLRVKDQSGTTRSASKYIYFTPKSSQFTGDLVFSVANSSIKSLKLDFNFRGPALKSQEWSFSVYNAQTGAFEKLTNNSGAKAWNWSSLSYSMSGELSKFVSSKNEIVLRYSSKGGEGSALDYVALTLTTGAPPAPMPTPTPTPSPSPTPSPTPSPSPSPTPSPSPSPSPSPTPADPTRAFNGVRPYGAKAPWNIPVKDLPLHPESAKYANYLWEDFRGKIPELNFRKYTFPVYNAEKATDQYVIKDKNGWGNLNGKTIPFNPSWKQNDGTDAQLIILDPKTGREWNLWEAVIDTSAKQITIGNGNLCPGDYLTNNWDNKATKCTGSRGVGINYLAMLVRPWEIEQGKIEHALSMPIIGTSGQFYVAPATKLEHPGKVGTIPEGMRFALNVTYKEIDDFVATLTGLTEQKRKAIKVILVALKDYGWFVTDTAGGHTFHFEAPESAQSEWERIGVLPGQSFGGVEHPRFTLYKFLTKERIITIVPSDQYPASATGK